MTAISVTFTPKVAADWDPQKPLTTTKLNQLFNNTTHLREWLGASYTAGAAQDHDHNGVNSALIEVGANLLRNGSFESGSTGWTLTPYTGGTQQVQTSGAMHGKYCLAMTSTVLANGGGDAVSDKYEPVSPNLSYFAQALFKASAANISSKIEIIWYDSAQAQISVSSLLTVDTPTAQTMLGINANAPATAAYARVKVYGGVPAQGSATGTIYIDGCVLAGKDLFTNIINPGTFYQLGEIAGASNVVTPTSENTNSISYVEKFCAVILQSGYYKVSFDLRRVGNTAYGRVYKNGSAFGTERVTGSTTYVNFTEDLYFAAGDTIQLFARNSVGGTESTDVKSFKVGILGKGNLISPVIDKYIGFR